MGSLLARCPKTDASIDTGIETEAESLKKVWNAVVLVRCPHCNDEHAITVRDAFVQDEISDLRMRGR